MDQLYCTAIKKNLLGLVVDRVISCDDLNKSSVELHLPASRCIIVVEQESGMICSVDLYDPLMQRDIELIIFPDGTTCLPGFIDCHVHLTIGTDDYQLDHLRLSSADKALRALKAAQGLLHAGFTTVRTAGDADTMFSTFALNRSIMKGDFVGPRIFGAGHYISVTGGGGDINFLSKDSCSCCATDGRIADGVDEMVKAVREEIKFGSDWIKILVTGAFMSASTNRKDNPENTHFSEKELRVVVEEASRRQVPVMAHAHGAEGIRMAAEAGCRSIEHASFIDQAGIDACLANNVWIVPTFLIGVYYDDMGSVTGHQDRMIELQTAGNERYRDCIRTAVDAGVKVALGSDFVGWDPSITAREFEYLVTWGGLTPWQSICAGTCSAADMLDQPQLGRVKAGCIADLVVVNGNPLEDIKVLANNVAFVMKGGKIVRNDCCK